MQMGPAGECQPLNCAKAMACIEGARDPSNSPLQLSQLRGELLECPPCLHAFDMEVKLLRTLEENTIRPVGSDREIPVDCRIVASTQADLAA